MVSKPCLFLLSFVFFSKCDDSFFMVQEYDPPRFYCITNSSSAISWIPEPGNNHVSEFLPQHSRKHRGLRCTKSENRQYECIKSREAVLDRRWEELGILGSNDTVATIGENFEVPFSVVAPDGVEVNLWEGTTRYTFSLGKETVIILKCDNGTCGHTFTVYPHPLDTKLWNHLVVSKSGNSLSLGLVNGSKMAEIRDDSPFSPTTMTVTGFWKLHEIEITKFTRKVHNHLIRTFDVHNGSVCVAIFVKSCQSCQFQFVFKTGKDKLSKIQTFESSSQWREIQIMADGMKHPNATLWLMTVATTVSQKGQFWLYSSVRTCYGTAFRMLTSEREATCQLVGVEGGVTSTVGEGEESGTTNTGVPCWWFTRKCDQLKICQDGVCYYTSKPRNRNWWFLVLLGLLLVPVVVYFSKKRPRLDEGIPLEIFNPPENVTGPEPPKPQKADKPKVLETLEDLPRYSASPSRPKTQAIPVDQFHEYVKKSVGNGNFLTQFQALPKIQVRTVNNSLVLACGSVPKVYIASVVPQPKQYTAFWQFVWTENVENVALLDNAAIQTKNYWPKLNQTLEFGTISVKCTNENIYAHFEHRQFYLSQNSEARLVEQLRFCRCADYDTPLAYVPFFQQFSKISLKRDSPVLVQCSLGVGPTGFAILCDMSLRIAVEDGCVDVFDNARRLAGLLNDAEYYKLAHLVVLESLLLAGKEANLYANCENFENFVKYLRETQWIDQNDKDKEKCEYFRAISSDYIGEVVLQPFIPNQEIDQLLESLSGTVIDGHKSPNKYLLTPEPTTQNFENFWKTVIRMQVSVIVSLNPRFGIKQNSKVTLGPRNTTETHTAATVILQNGDSKLHKNVQIFCVLKWPLDVPDFVRFCVDVHKKTTKTNQILVACPDGISASGMYIAMDWLIGQYQEENKCDLYLAARTIRRHQPTFPKNEDQLKYLWEARECHLKEYQVYEVCQ